MSSSAAASVPTLGRFELKRVLGRGAQSTVWLGFDPRLEREVAIKLMRLASGSGGSDATAALEQWLREARTVGRLAHPHIVPVFEADVHADGSGAQPYIVFEFVPGQSLAERLRQQGAYAPRAAAELMLGVLDALAHAHASGVVHRDLKPSNILIDAAGRARVTDFGIAVTSGDAQGAVPAGSPGYLSPEAVRGLAPAPSMDVFAAGLVLAELMTGKPLIAEADVPRAMYRIAHEDLGLPEAMPQPVDDGLRALVQRALAREPSARFAHAGELRDALMAWLAPKSPVPEENGSAPAAARSGASGTLEFLLRRMRHKSDFPALSDSVASIQRVATSENESLSSLASEILKDVALTHKLLRLVNTAHFQHAGGGTISTVSRAVALVGFAGIRNLALSLVLLEHMNDKLHADQIKQEFLRSLMAGTLASELSPVSSESEEAFIGSMFQGLGRLLTEFYFHEEAEQIRSLVHPGVTLARETPRQPMNEQVASASVLGLSYEELGLGVARSWGLPDTLQRCMRPATGVPPAEMPKQTPERLRWLATAANEVADVMLHAEPQDAPRLVAQVAERHAKALGLKAKDVQDAVVRSRTRLTQLAAGLQLHLKPGSPAERLLEPKPQPVTDASGRDPMTDTLSRHQLEATAPLPLDALPPHEDPAHVLAAGIQDITNSMVAENFKLNEVLRMILETMYRALGFRRVVFCLRDGRTGRLVGRFGLGEGAEPVVALFQVPLAVAAGSNPDLFTAVCLKGADTMISDATGHIESRLPPWFREKVKAPTFLLLPLQMKNATFGLIYADKAKPGGISLSEKELSLLRTLRNQAVMAFRTANSG